MIRIMTPEASTSDPSDRHPDGRTWCWNDLPFVYLATTIVLIAMSCHYSVIDQLTGATAAVLILAIILILTYISTLKAQHNSYLAMGGLTR